MADISYPSTLPDFKAGKSRNQPQTYRTTAPFAGPLFTQFVTDESPVSWDVTVTCANQLQARQFQAFLRKTNNGVPFTKFIWTEEGYVEHEVKWVQMPLQPTQVNNFVWQYSGVILASKLIQPDSDINNDDLILSWLQDADIIDNALNNLWS